MVRAPDDDAGSPEYEQNWYARVLGIYHANVWTSDSRVPGGDQVRRMDFLQVRWFGAEPGHKHGFACARLPKIGFVPETDEFAFGFLDPMHIIRGCHLIPAFAAGRTSELLSNPRSAARLRNPDETDDWMNFYVNMWVFHDRF